MQLVALFIYYYFFFVINIFQFFKLFKMKRKLRFLFWQFFFFCGMWKKRFFWRFKKLFFPCIFCMNETQLCWIDILKRFVSFFFFHLYFFINQVLFCIYIANISYIFILELLLSFVWWTVFFWRFFSPVQSLTSSFCLLGKYFEKIELKKIFFEIYKEMFKKSL